MFSSPSRFLLGAPTLARALPPRFGPNQTALVDGEFSLQSVAGDIAQPSRTTFSNGLRVTIRR